MSNILSNRGVLGTVTIANRYDKKEINDVQFLILASALDYEIRSYLFFMYCHHCSVDLIYVQ